MSSTVSFSKQIRRIKPADHLALEGEHGGLRRSMGLTALLLFSVGSVVGTGIFVILGEAVPKAGPAVLLSFVLAAVTCAFSALSYAELAGSIPVSGSSYSYTYATLGELVAWITGWCLMLEYGVSVSAVAVGWGQYLNEFLSTFGLEIPAQFANPPGEGGGVFNIPAVVVVVSCMFLLLRGISESAKVNTVMVLLKIAVLVFFCAVAFTTFEPGNFVPFAPLGLAGISAAAGQVFFSYIGFDAASTAGEEAKNPRRDLPRAIVGSLLIVTIIYVAVAAAAIGARPWEDFEGEGAEAVLASIARDVTGADWAPALIAAGAVVSIFSVVLVTMYGQTRILFAMGRDGLLPKVFTRVNPRTQTPVTNTIIVTVVVSVLAAFVPLGQLAEATSIGTLAAFAIVNFGVIALWVARPELPRTFKVPLLPLFPILGVIFCVYLIASLDVITWIVFFLWLAVGMVVYLAYGRRHATAAVERTDVIHHEVAGETITARRMGTGTLIGALGILGIGAFALYEGFANEAMTGGKQILWIGLAVVCFVGAAVAAQAMGTDRSGRAEIAAGSTESGVLKVRAAMWRSSGAILVPGVALVLTTLFAAPGA